ncbi:glycerate kinase [Escherichia coli]
MVQSLYSNDIDISGLDPRLKDCVIRVACDVTNPLVGDNGASRAYWPTKREPVKR